MSSTPGKKGESPLRGSNPPSAIDPAACPGAQLVKAIYRTQPVQSQCARHKLALGPIPIEQHHLARNRKVLTLRQTYFVDNVTTSGHTLEAARLALGFGAGLVFADAATRHTQIQATLF